MIKLVFQLQAKSINSKPPTPPPDELDLRVTNFYRVYGKKNTKYAEKKKGVKQKSGNFRDMSDVLWSVCVFLFFSVRPKTLRSLRQQNFGT